MKCGEKRMENEELRVKNEVWRMRFGFGLRFVEGW